MGPRQSTPEQKPDPQPKPDPKPAPKPAEKPAEKPEPKPEQVGPKESYTIRCAIIGNQKVGKSSLAERYGNGNFKENSLPETTFAQYVEKDKIIIGNKSIRLVMLDTPGATAMLTTVKLNKQAFVFLVFDVSDKSSFENL